MIMSKANILQLTNIGFLGQSSYLTATLGLVPFFLAHLQHIILNNNLYHIKNKQDMFLNKNNKIILTRNTKLS
jgi:hypothetical protein